MFAQATASTVLILALLCVAVSVVLLLMAAGVFIARDIRMQSALDALETPEFDDE